MVLVLTISFFCWKSSSQVVGLMDSRLNTVTLDSVFKDLKPGSVVILGEKHYNNSVKKQHIEVLNYLRSLGLKTSVGMEFFSFTQQSEINDFRNQKMNEKEFLDKTLWGNLSFDFYREQFLFPDQNQGESLIGLNSPKFLTRKVSKQGIDKLTDDDKKLLPPNFSLGRESYKKRFLKVMPHNLSPEVADRYFQAQSLWDDTMAWVASEFIKKNQDHVLVIIVGEFHLQYGGGLIDRLKARGIQSILGISQLDSNDYESQTDLIKDVQASEEFGPRADYIWVF